jgi:hypothetical protein
MAAPSKTSDVFRILREPFQCPAWSPITRIDRRRVVSESSINEPLFVSYEFKGFSSLFMLGFARGSAAVSFARRSCSFDKGFQGAFFRIAVHRVDQLAEVEAYCSISDQSAQPAG